MPKVDQEQPSLQERPSWDDHERAVAIGEEFGLGVLVKVLRNRKFPAMTGWGALLGLVTLVVVLPITGGVAAGSYPAAVKVVVAAGFGALFLYSCLLVVRGVSRSRVDGHLFRYSGGLAQLIRDNPEPLVVRWADTDAFIVSVYEADRANAYLTGFTLHSATGTTLPGLRRYRRPELHDLVTWIGKALTAHLVPEMTERYESGEALVFGKVGVEQAAITVESPGSGPEVIAWTGIHSITVTHLPQAGAMRIPQHITITRKAGRGVPVEIQLSGMPNGVFLPPVLAHVARQNGIPMYGYEESSPQPRASLAAQPPPTAPPSSVAPPPSAAAAPPPSAAPASSTQVTPPPTYDDRN